MLLIRTQPFLALPRHPLPRPRRTVHRHRLAAARAESSSSGEDSKNELRSVAAFSLGCFWGSETAFAAVPGVRATRVGYTGSAAASPTYESVCAGDGHAESVRVEFSPSAVSYETLLGVFFQEHNPTKKKHKPQYRSAIWCADAEQMAAAKAAKAGLEKRFGLAVLTEIRALGEWHDAEERHQQYDQKRAAKLRLARGEAPPPQPLPMGEAPDQ